MRSDRWVQRAAEPSSVIVALGCVRRSRNGGASRMRNAAGLTPEQIQVPHGMPTRQEVARRTQVVMIGDAAVFHVSRHHDLHGTGPIGGGSLAQGLFVSTVLVCNARTERLIPIVTTEVSPLIGTIELAQTSIRCRPEKTTDHQRLLPAAGAGHQPWVCRGGCRKFRGDQMTNAPGAAVHQAQTMSTECGQTRGRSQSATGAASHC